MFFFPAQLLIGTVGCPKTPFHWKARHCCATDLEGLPDVGLVFGVAWLAVSCQRIFVYRIMIMAYINLYEIQRIMFVLDKL